MGDRYHVNDTAQLNGDHEVHKEGCGWLAMARYTTFLGTFDRCQEAVALAKRKYSTANGCAYCATPCHTS